MQHDRLTPEELSALPAKTKKHQDVCDLYLEHDYLTAYSMHTDLRVADRPEGAIGNHLEWDAHGEIQLAFLVSQGMTPEHRLLDIGCGTGRLARKAAPYLNDGNYTGVDISEGAIEYARNLSFIERWSAKLPNFVVSRNLDVTGPFDFIWAFSVFIHLPNWAVRDVISKAAMLLTDEGKFFFSYVPEKVAARTGLKQFRNLESLYREACALYGLTFIEVKWPAQQHIGLAQRK